MTGTVVVTGMSVLAAGAGDLEAFTRCLDEGVSGIAETDLFDTLRLGTDYFGQVRGDYRYEVTRPDEQSRLEQFFAQLRDELFARSGLDAAGLSALGDRCGFSFATSVGSNDYLNAHATGTLPGSISWSTLYRLASTCGIEGPVMVNCSACAAGSTAIATGYSMLLGGSVDVVVAGGIDPLTEFSTFGFHALKSLSPFPCKPFDRDRQGISIGEGGALVVLETGEHAAARGAHVHAELLGYGLGNDAYHPTSPDPTGEGALRVMTSALSDGGITGADVAYVNAHGTGTQLNDQMEVAAVESLGGHPVLASTKAITGHCLGAAGAVEAVATVLAVAHRRAYGTTSLREPAFETTHCELLSRTRDADIRYALSNSFAFGGNACSLLFGAVDD
jgi:3-oxoacyl-[acyl-carrier-protein] synthase II